MGSAGSRRTGPPSMRAGDHAQRAVCRGRVVEEHDRGDHVLGFVADRGVPVGVVLVPRELAALGGALEVELGRERRGRRPELVDDGAGEARVVEERAEVGVQVVARLEQTDRATALVPLPLDRGAGRELDAMAVAQVADGPASGRRGVFAHRRGHGFDRRAEPVALGGVEHAFAHEVAVGAERGAVPGGRRGRWHGAEATRPPVRTHAPPGRRTRNSSVPAEGAIVRAAVLEQPNTPVAVSEIDIRGAESRRGARPRRRVRRVPLRPVGDRRLVPGAAAGRARARGGGRGRGGRRGRDVGGARRPGGAHAVAGVRHAATSARAAADVVLRLQHVVVLEPVARRHEPAVAATARSSTAGSPPRRGPSGRSCPRPAW